MRIRQMFAVFAVATLLDNVPRVRADSRQEFVRRVYDSVVLLYTQSGDGSMTAGCTATAYRTLRNGDKVTGYRLVSASHCTTDATDAEIQNARYFATADSSGVKTFVPAKLIQASDRSTGDDFAIFEVGSGVVLDTVSLGDSDKLTPGEAVINVAFPLGLGKQLFTGVISSEKLDRPPMKTHRLLWKNMILVQIGAGPGSSGSAIVSEEQKAIVAIFVGLYPGKTVGVITLPISRFRAFEAAVDGGTYKKTPGPPCNCENGTE